MPLETIGSLAVAGSSGANARGARPVNDDFTNAVGRSAFTASLARGGNSGANIIELPSPAPNLAAYLSPFIRLDLQTRLAIVQFRDSETGEVERQYPSRRAIREYTQNLPEDSNLRGTSSEDAQESPQARIVGSTTGDDTSESLPPPPTFGTGQAQSGDEPPVLPFTAVAAFNSVQNALTGGRELAVA